MNLTQINDSRAGENNATLAPFEEVYASHYIVSDNLPNILLPMFGAFILGALWRTLLKESRLPYTVVLLVTGIVLGTLGHYVSQVSPYTSCISDISPVLLMHIFMPVLTFNAAFEMDPYTLWKIRGQVALLVFPGYIMSSLLTGILTVKLFRNNWSWLLGILFGIIVSSTDPVLTVASLKDTVTSKAIIILLEAEALLCNSACILLFEILKELFGELGSSLGTEIAILCVLKFLGSPILAFIVCKLLMFWLSRIFNDALTEVVVSFAAVYVLFYLAEWWGMCGIIAVTCLGLFLDKSCYSSDSEVLLTRFWEVLIFLANTLMFLFVGVLMATQTFVHTTATDIFYVVVLYIGVNVIRFMVIFALRPLLSRTGYGLNWKWGVLIIWSGFRGAFTLTMALIAFQTEGLGTIDDKNKILLYISLVTLLTLLINAPLVQKIVTALGLHNISVPKRMAMYSAVRRIQENLDKTLSMLKMDRFLANANWSLVKSSTDIDDPDQMQANTLLEEQFPHFRMVTCPDCKKEIPSNPSQKELEEMQEEARIRILKAEITSFFKQYNCGMLNREATRTLVGAAESQIDSIGKFMDIEDVKKNWEAKGFLVFLRRQIEQWVYSIKKERVKCPRSKFLKIFYGIVLNDLFDYAIYIVILINLFSVLVDFIPYLSEMYSLELNILNITFMMLYFFEAIIKVLALRKAYFFSYWNLFDFLLLIFGIVEMIVDNILNEEKLKSIKILRFLRLLRALRLFKILMPSVLRLIDKKLNKQLSLGYDIAMGFVVSEEDVKNLIEQISDQAVITKSLRTILEKNRQQSIKELGILQRDHPEIVTAVKTRQAIQTMLNRASETLKILVTGGVMDNLEALKLEKVIRSKVRRLSNLPSSISPPTTEDLLHSVPWLQDSSDQIQFLQSRAKICFFDYLDVICKEGDMPIGIQLMVSGMVKIHGSNPVYGHFNNKEEKEACGKTSAPPYTDYRTSGAILCELNCLTRQEMEYTVTCETAVQTCFVSLNDLFEAFDLFLENPSLEYKMWLSVAIQIAVRTFKENIFYQKLELENLSNSIADSYLEDVELNQKLDVYDGTMNDVVLVYGSIVDRQQLISYFAPCVVPKTCHQIQGTATITKILIVPNSSGPALNATANGKDSPSMPCLQHAAAHRRVSRQPRGKMSIAKRESLFDLKSVDAQVDTSMDENQGENTKTGNQ